MGGVSFRPAVGPVRASLVPGRPHPCAGTAWGLLGHRPGGERTGGPRWALPGTLPDAAMAAVSPMKIDELSR
jgi:hypothetical protein